MEAPTAELLTALGSTWEDVSRPLPELAEFTYEPGHDGAEWAKPGGGQLAVHRFADLAREVDSRGPRRGLIRGIWPAGDYGVHGAEPKAGKTWNSIDLAVSVGSGTPWLGAVPIDTTGPVLVFAGEGGEGNVSVECELSLRLAG